MASATETRTSTLTKPAEGELRFVIHNLSWDRYEAILELFGDDGPRMNYCQGTLELMSPLIPRARYKRLFGDMIEALTEELDIPRNALGSTTFKQRLARKGLEPDECYFIANAGKMISERRPDLDIDPPPDLAIEIEITNSLVNKLEIYAGIGVPEIWRFDGETLTVLLLQPDGSYLPSETSLSFPFWPMSEIVRFLEEYSVTNETRWGSRFESGSVRHLFLNTATPTDWSNLMSNFVGIDLGTTNSVVAARNAYGRPEVIANGEGRNITPSVIYFGATPPAVGDEAKEWARLGNDEIASFFKPHMGSPLYKLRFHGRDYDATDLSSLILKKLKADAEARLGSTVDHAVITVPAYFADAQRKATIEAGRLAGLNVARIIHEPTAAALAYGLQKSGVEETVLIYDLGGGTFDVTVARITPNEVVVLSTAGDRDLGGKDWDDLIATYLAEKFAGETGLDPLDDPIALNEVLTLAEQAKWALSERTSARITLQIDQQRKSYELSRAEFEAMTFPLMDRTRRLTEEALEEAGLTWKGLAGVLLVGGSTRMPMVRTYVKEMAGQDPRAGVNVDEVVALGAAIQAGIEAGEAMGDAVPKFRLGGPISDSPRFTLAGARKVIDVMSHGLGAVAVSPDGSSYVNDVIIRRNRPIPVEDSRSYLHETHGGRNETLEIYLTQGESSRPLDCSILGKYVFSGIQATDAEVTVDVKMSYDVNGVVQVRAQQRDTGHTLKLKVEPVPDDLSWLGLPPLFQEPPPPSDPTRIYLLIDISASMAGTPLLEAQQAARAFLERCDFTRTEVGLISFSEEVTLQAEATDNVRKVQAALARLEPDTTTNLSDAIDLARQKLNRLDRTRYIVLLTDGYPDAAEDAVEHAVRARGEGIEIVAIGMGDADLDYLRRLASTEEGSIFANKGELVGTFGHIARIIAEGGRSLRKLL